MKQRISVLVALLVVLSMVLTACGGGAAPAAAPAETTAADERCGNHHRGQLPRPLPAASGEAVTIEYWLWDANQLPAYQACADAFMARPTPTSRSTSRRAAGTTTGTASRPAWSPARRPTSSPITWPSIPEFAAKEQLVDIQPFVERDGVDTERLPGPADRPVGPRRQALRPAQGLGHHRHRVQPDCARRRRRDGGRTEQHHLEPGERRHLWRADRQAERRRERQQRPQPRLRPDQGQAVRPDHQRRRRRLRPDRVELADQHDRLAANRRAVCHQPTTTTTSASSTRSSGSPTA